MPSKPFVFFDIGHTLVTGAAQSPRRLLGTALQLDEKQTKRVGKLIMTTPCTEPEVLSKAIARVLPDHPVTQIHRAVCEIWEDQILCVREIEPASELIRTLKGRGCRVGLISNIWHPFFEGFRRTCPEIIRLSDFCLLSYRFGKKKPHPSVYETGRQAAEEAGADTCWMIGDSYELDIAPAQKAGMKGLWILCRPERERELLVDLVNGRCPRPHGCVSSLEEVLDFFANLGV
ncbi:FMN phosphatase YigB, HAD superfamily [Desulfacinum hydrothermale DSM 13146]|uniref:FMN phosphatase YigB, HAD superfamily n=1 Tax=Desulfacinum hydrothermale DSM 13146 TaxID=1121390 RepID=A0A1W1XFR6_9BACT|nr:HAD family hydrolase [Desulfacinum hydrothermale]SMC22835.1 FMN phosphatase YigB, HAD superfamily [Desulfacinum hydrothermale DSM 13146]